MAVPDGPKTPPLWQLLQWIRQPLTYLDTNASRYGDCFIGHFAGLPKFWFISNPQAIAAIFTADAQQFDSGQGNQILRPTLGDGSILLLDGNRHQRQRQLLMPPFHGERMRAYGQLISEITEQVVQQWGINQPFTLRPRMQEISLGVILQVVFGLHTRERCEQLRQMLNAFLALTTSPLGNALAFFPGLQRDLGAWSPQGRFFRLRQQIDQLIYAEIAQHRQSPDTGIDILSLLLAARDDAGEPMSDEELRDELMTLLLAGHETTATAMTWALYWIHTLPTVKAILLAELNSLEDDTDTSAIARLPYLHAVCCETLRIYPIALITLPRIVKSSMELMGYQLPPGTVLAPCIYLTHRRPDLYPEPQQFRPERFLEQQFSPYEYLPFGGSNRRCIGAAFALFEMKLVLSRILRSCQLERVDQRPVRPTRRGVTMAPAGGVRILRR
ncbi:cytochrome P450 [Neosynechococcus sphagnicola sy1]|uniref:Cytochrome P450 n=1 Tax=Neosynechococcus sphagnicola sy1 TaxID=1497020 RepID=A0A098TIW3_9CYAN|nr:cytochrome P450 [Neosynechococcus sphagnicola]KGF72495.1 cytochrome P450 [Neosynechococcus sphagnicola sy1]